MLRGGSEGPSEEGDRPIGEPAASPESESQDETDFETADESMSGAKSAASGSSVDFAPNASPTPPEYNGVEYALYCRREYERACAASGDERAYKKNDKVHCKPCSVCSIVNNHANLFFFPDSFGPVGSRLYRLSKALNTSKTSNKRPKAARTLFILERETTSS